MPGHFWDLEYSGTIHLDASENRVDPLVTSWPFHTEDDDQPSTLGAPYFQTNPKDVIFLGIMDLGKFSWIPSFHPWPTPMATYWPNHQKSIIKPSISPSAAVAEDENGEVPHQRLGLRSLRPWHAIGGTDDQGPGRVRSLNDWIW